MSGHKEHSFTTRKHAHGVYFSVGYSENIRKDACVITKKTAPRSVDRNTAKRRCRAALHESRRSSPAPLSFSVRIKSAALGAPYARLREELTELVRQLQDVYLKSKH